MTRNQLTYWANQEAKRSNLANERETNRHNVVTEGETERHNRVGEGETSRHNIAVETETGRHNRVTEDQGQQTIDETKRHNISTETIDLGRLNETIRHNQRTEGQTDVSLGLTAKQLAEAIRHNKASEGLTSVDLSISAAQQKEQARHNLSSELNTAALNQSQINLNNANADIRKLESRWTNMLNSGQYSLTASEIARINAQIDQLNEQAALLRSQTTGQDFNNAFKTYDEVLRGIDTISNSVSKFKPSLIRR